MLPPSEFWRGSATDADDYSPALFSVDIIDPDFQRHPELDGMLVYEALLEAGDFLFIPSGWGHQAHNLNAETFVPAL